MVYQNCALYNEEDADVTVNAKQLVVGLIEGIWPNEQNTLGLGLCSNLTLTLILTLTLTLTLTVNPI